MPDNEKYPTLYEDDNYLIFRSEDKEMVTCVLHNLRISFMLAYEEWREFARVMVSAANKDCENEQKADDQIRSMGGTQLNAIDRMIQNAIKPLQDRIDELERELHEPTEGEVSIKENSES